MAVERLQNKPPRNIEEKKLGRKARTLAFVEGAALPTLLGIFAVGILGAIGEYSSAGKVGLLTGVTAIFMGGFGIASFTDDAKSSLIQKKRNTGQS